MSDPSKPEPTEPAAAPETPPAAWHTPSADDDSAADYASLVRRGWEMELIISGFLTFALLQVPEAIDRLTAHIFIEGLTLLSQNNDLFALVFIKSLSLILAGHFVLHIALRAVWVAFIGLQLSFPGGARLESLKLPERYRRHLPADPSNVGTMRSLDRLASSVYGFALLVVGCLITVLLLYLIGTLIVYIGSQLGLPEWAGETFQAGYYFLLILAAIDFFSAGALRRARWLWLQRFFYPLHRFVAWLGGAGWYQPLYYVFITRLDRRWFAPFLLVYLVLAVVVAQSTTDISLGPLPNLPIGNTYEHLPSLNLIGPVADAGLTTRSSHYEDQRDYRNMVTYKLPSIESQVLRRDRHSVRLTIPYWQLRWFEPGIARNCPELKPFQLAWWSDLDADSAGLADDSRLADVQALMDCFSQRFLRVAVNDSLLPPLRYQLTAVAHPLGTQPVVRAYIATDHLPQGHHRLFVRYERLLGPRDSMHAMVLTIPFYKE